MMIFSLRLAPQQQRFFGFSLAFCAVRAGYGYVAVVVMLMPSLRVFIHLLVHLVPQELVHIFWDISASCREFTINTSHSRSVKFLYCSAFLQGSLGGDHWQRHSNLWGEDRQILRAESHRIYRIPRYIDHINTDLEDVSPFNYEWVFFGYLIYFSGGVSQHSVSFYESHHDCRIHAEPSQVITEIPSILAENIGTIWDPWMVEPDIYGWHNWRWF